MIVAQNTFYEVLNPETNTRTEYARRTDAEATAAQVGANGVTTILLPNHVDEEDDEVLLADINTETDETENA